MAHRLQPLNNTVALCFDREPRNGEKRKSKGNMIRGNLKEIKGIPKGKKSLFPLAAGGELLAFG